MIKETAIKIMNLGYVCDYCLGRQFAKLSSGYSNKERGKIIRDFLAIEHESEKTVADPSNFVKKGGKCVICGNLLEELPEFSEKALEILKKTDFESFMTGVKMNDLLVMNEENLWEKAGMKYSEPIKSEINRELSNMISEKTGKKTEQRKPDILIIFDFEERRTEIFYNPIFVYGEYKKFLRGLPQTSSPRYKQTVQDIIAKPLIKVTSSTSSILHALGREDMDARCLVWRPFILELKQPVKREADMNKIKKQINRGKKVKVRNLRFCNKEEVSILKSKRPHKVYKLIVNFEKPVEGIERAKKLIGVVRQKTPKKVLCSKSEKIKNKKVKSIKWKRINNKRYLFEIITESGLYIKELVSEDSCRTNPSLSSILCNRAKVKEFDLTGLED